MKSGFTLIEIMLAVAVSAVILPALVIALSFSLQAAKQGERYTKAYAFAQEQMEAIRTLKKNEVVWDWETTPVNTSPGEYYQPEFISGSWQLGSKTTDPVQTEGYVKKVEIRPVKRDATGNLSDDPWALVDDYSRWVTVYVTWTQNGQDEEIHIDSLHTMY